MEFIQKASTCLIFQKSMEVRQGERAQWISCCYRNTSQKIQKIEYQKEAYQYNLERVVLPGQETHFLAPAHININVYSFHMGNPTFLTAFPVITLQVTK